MMPWWLQSPRTALAYLIAPRDLKILIALGSEHELAARAIAKARADGVTDAEIQAVARHILEARRVT